MNLPKTIAIVITGRCNLRCEMCFEYGERSKKLGILGNALLPGHSELSYEQIKSIIRKINKYYPREDKPELFITGGEPFFRKDMYRIIKFAANEGNNITVNTNFTLVTKKLAEKLVKIKNFFPLISVDGPEIIHDRIRNYQGSYKKTLRNIAYFSNNKKRCMVCTTITKYNVDYLIDLYKVLKDFKVHWFLKHVDWMPEEFITLQGELSKEFFGVDFEVFIPQEVSVPENKIRILEKQLNGIKELAKDNGEMSFSEIARPEGVSLFDHHCTFKCNMKNRVCKSPEINILPNGDVSYCNGPAYGLGPKYANLLRDDLLEVLTRRESLEKTYKTLLLIGKVPPVCVKCSYFEKKRGYFENKKIIYKSIGRRLWNKYLDIIFND